MDRRLLLASGDLRLPPRRRVTHSFGPLRFGFALALALALALAGVPAHAMKIDFDFFFIDIDPTLSATTKHDVKRAYRRAGANFQSTFSDSITVSLLAAYDPLGEDTLAQAGSSVFKVSYADVYATLGGDVTSALDANAVAHLEAPGDGIRYVENPLGTANLGYIDTQANLRAIGPLLNDRGNGLRDDNDFMSITTACAKALGIVRNYLSSDTAFPVFDGFTYDGFIDFSRDFGFDPTDGVTPALFDFVSVATHEIGHAPGFVSGVDAYDFFTGQGPCRTLDCGFDLAGLADDGSFGDVDGWHASVLDLFRYSSLSFAPESTAARRQKVRSTWATSTGRASTCRAARTTWTRTTPTSCSNTMRALRDTHATPPCMAPASRVTGSARTRSVFPSRCRNRSDSWSRSLATVRPAS